MSFTRQINKVSKSDVNLAGGKGASLGELMSAKILVPDGFVVLSSAFELFLQKNKLENEINTLLSKADVNDISTIEGASKSIHELIMDASIPKEVQKEILSSFKKLDSKFVAVRSSATAEDGANAAWAGQLETYLNSTSQNLLFNIKKCWASLFTPRAIFYRIENKLDKKHISIAVVIQKMIESEVSGIAFSVHPVTQDKNSIIIEASYGLGEAIVSGQVTPDSYVVAKDSLNITERNVSNKKKGLFRKNIGGNEWKEISVSIAKKQALTDVQIKELSILIKKIEGHYGFGCDIEWALEGGKFYIVQSRPITTLNTQNNFDSFQLEFTREVPLNRYFDWLYGYLETCRELKMNLDLPKKTFAIYEHGFVKGYTQENNIDLMKEAINSLSFEKINKLIDYYLNDYKKLKKTRKVDSKQIVKGFIITFLLGDMQEHPLQKKAYDARAKTQDLFIILPRTNYFNKSKQTAECLLCFDGILPITKLDLFLNNKKVVIGTGDSDANKRIIKIMRKSKGQSILPKIMYDQSQFTSFHWLDENGVWLSKEVFQEIEKISGYKPDKWYLYSQAQPSSFFFGAYDENSLKLESQHGLCCLKDSSFLKRFESEFSKMHEMSKSIKNEYIKNFKSKELKVIKANPKKAIDILKKIKNDLNFMMKYYFLTQPQRFYDVEKSMEIHSDSEKLLSLLECGRTLSPLSLLRSEVLIYAESIKKSNLDFESYCKKNPKQFKKIKILVEKYGFLNESILGGKYFDLDDLKKEIKSVLRKWDGYKQELDQLMEQKKKIEKRNLLFKKNNSKEIYRLAEATGQMLFYRMAIQTYVLSLLHSYSRLISQIGIFYKIKKQELDVYSFNDLISLLTSGKKLNSKEVNKRRKGFLIIYSRDGVRTYFGSDAHGQIKELLIHRLEEIKNKQAMSGKIACWSHKEDVISGRAFVITSAFDVEKKLKSFKDGDIIIATQTHPNLVPFMKRARAIITDEGGITCHAAIVSREIGKTCIIGTRLATKVIKMGDLIEINKTNGSVKILNRK